MTRLWTETFDSQSAAGWNTTNGTVAYDTTAPRRGAASLRCAPATAVASSIAKAAYGADDPAAHVYMRAYVRVNTAPSARTAILAWSDNASGATGFACIKLNTDRTMICGGSGATSGTASAALTIGQWYRVEMEYDDTANQVKAYLNGTLWATVSTDLGGGHYSRYGIIQPAIASVDFDDVAVNDAAGGSDNGLPGNEPTTTTLALGTATETSSAQSLAGRRTRTLGVAAETSTALKLGRPLAQLRDNFNDNTVGPFWPANYNTAGAPPTETGGRARVPCDTGYAAYASAYAWTLQGSGLSCRFYPAALNGATTECWSQVLIQTMTPGTDVTIEYNGPTDTLAMTVRVGYSDPGYTAIPYDPVAHAYVRIREAGGVLYWDTSPDGSAWTNRRTETAPAWVADPDLQVQLISHRSDGTANFAEYDDVNPLSTAASLTPATETDTSRALTGTKRLALTPAIDTSTARGLPGHKTRVLAVAVQTDTALPLPGTKRGTLPSAAETDTGRALTSTKRLALTPGTETSSAQPLPGHKTRALLTTAETTAAQPFASHKARALAIAAETATAQPLIARKARALGAATETSTALPPARTKTRSLTPAVQTDTARAIAGTKTRALTPATDLSTALPLGSVLPDIRWKINVGPPHSQWASAFGTLHTAPWEVGEPWT
ncbi:hypothetical protein OOK29_25995 [Streptomyces phaeochromogenes]|uniref:hypothetical protein n=1 Tax=Streptomyces phaeochromogenes TaxID=1923 RepID=UPI0022518E03|nr:hypothetical protein [Streptomyces phaeochromogenes]MCX5601607.1 hypothetical protein [Streptomyces phaeochromogenes]